MTQTNKEYALPSDPNRAMQEMMSTIDHLREIYIRENEALDTADTKSFFALQDDKYRAAEQYQSGIQQILTRKDEIRAVDPALKQRLERKQKEFSEIARKNAEALERMNRCMERLGDIIRGAAGKAAAQERGLRYDGSGRMQPAGNKAVSTGLQETA